MVFLKVNLSHGLNGLTVCDKNGIQSKYYYKLLWKLFIVTILFFIFTDIYVILVIDATNDINN